MKKKMTVLCGLLMAVVITAYSVSGTYAKYTSSMSTTDTARVARWSINVGDSSTKTLDLFKDVYGDNKVVGTDGALVVAPGTSGSYKFEFSGNTEVAYTLAATATITNNTVVYDGDTTVSPIKFSIDGGTTWFEAADLANELSDAISGTYDAGEVTVNPITLQWKWAYDLTDLATMTGITPTAGWDANKFDLEDTLLGQKFIKAYNDAYDAEMTTQLGGNKFEDLTPTQQANAIAAAKAAGEAAQKADGVEPTITLDITITATQVQP